MGKKELLAWVLMKTGLLKMLELLMGPRLVVFNYHRIRSNNPRQRPIFDENVYGPTEAVFEQHVALISERFYVAGQRDLIDIAEGRRALDRLMVTFTFDDGYKDNYELAYPILKKYNVPAIFFIPTEFIDERKVGWWDHVAYILRHCKKSQITLRGETLDLGENRDRVESQIKHKFVVNKQDVYAGLIEELADECGVVLPTKDLESKQMMTWAEIKEMSDNGYTIGSHGQSHSVLTTLTEEQVRSELQHSKVRIEEVVEKPVRSLAYPVGYEKTFDSSVEDIAAQTGYDLAFSFNTGVNEGSMCAHNVRRIYPHTSPAWVVGVTVWPDLFMWGG